MSGERAINKERIKTIKERLERHLKPVLAFERDAVANDMPLDTRQNFLDAISRYVDFIWKDGILRPRLSVLLDRLVKIKDDPTLTGVLSDLRNAVAGAIEAVKQQIMASDAKVQEAFRKPAGPDKFTWEKAPRDGHPHSVGAVGWPVLANVDDSYEKWLDRDARSSEEELKLENVAALLPMEAFTQVEADDDFETIRKLGDSLREVGYVANTVGIQLDADAQKHFADADDARKRLDDHINYHLKNEGVHAAYHLVRVYAMYGRATYAEEIIDPVAMPVIREWQGRMEIFFSEDYWQRLYDIGCAGARKVGEVLGDYLRDGVAEIPNESQRMGPVVRFHTGWYQPEDRDSAGGGENTSTAAYNSIPSAETATPALKPDGIRCLISGEAVPDGNGCNCEEELSRAPSPLIVFSTALGVGPNNLGELYGKIAPGISDDPLLRLVIARECFRNLDDYTPVYQMIREAWEQRGDKPITFDDLPDKYKEQHYKLSPERRRELLGCLKKIFDGKRSWQSRAAEYLGVNKSQITRDLR